MKFGDSPELKQERARAGELSNVMRASLSSIESVRQALIARINRQTSTWQGSAPHTPDDEGAFVLRMRSVNAILQEINDVAATYHEEKQELNRLLIENSKKKDERLLGPLRRVNEICAKEIEVEYPKRVELNKQLEGAIAKLEEFVSVALDGQ
jgi:DNA anti-recombination protein RmuC